MDESLVKNQTLSIRSKDQLNIWSTMLMTTFIIEILGVHALHSFPDHVGHMRHQFSHSTIFDKIPLDSLHCKHIFLPQIARIEFFFFFLQNLASKIFCPTKFYKLSMLQDRYPYSMISVMKISIIKSEKIHLCFHIKMKANKPARLCTSEEEQSGPGWLFKHNNVVR